MRPRYPKGFSDVPDTDCLTGMDRAVHKHAQGIICIRREPDGDLLRG
jgi:hypothetical protein